MDELLNAIDALPNDRVLEAARILAGQDVAPTPTDALIDQLATQGTTADDRERLKRHLEAASAEQMAALARATLTCAVFCGREQDVRDAIDAAGERFLILELVAVGALMLAAYHEWRTQGKKEETRSCTWSIKPDGTVEIRHEETTPYFSTGQILGEAVKGVISKSQ